VAESVRRAHIWAAYNATKAAVTNFVRSLALDWGPQGVRLNVVAPSFTLTELTEGVGRDEGSLAPFVERIALGRPGEPDDYAPAVLFVAGPGARYITGAVLPVDGGTSASTSQPRAGWRRRGEDVSERLPSPPRS
jgi:meso-butanediol dehydrogenase/(S,S)-butanediol dehydrogenase/diacetyl reductase